MIKRLIFCIAIIAFFSANSEICAQQFKQFSGKKETFVNEVFAFLGKSNDESFEKIKHNFSIEWDSAKLTDLEKGKIILFSKGFIDKKARPIPDFYNYLKSMNLFIEKEHPKSSFDQWLEAFSEISNNRKTSLSIINRIIQQSIDLISENIMFKSASLVWKTSSKDFYFNYDGDIHVVFDTTDLICYAKRDSIIIFGTGGELRPVALQWIGKNGLVTWERAGFDRKIISASLSKYFIDLNKSSYVADSVSFTNKTYFDTPLLGHFEDNVTLISSPVSATYPKFDSYKKHFIIKELYPNVDYEGGFSMQGAKLVGKGNIENPARLDFFRKDTLRLKATSQYFIFRPEKVVGLDAAVRIYLEKDSVYHGDLQFTYTTKTKEISLIKSENYTAQSPYLNSYHGLDMNFDQLKWRIDEPLILITTTPGSSRGKALFESLNFFNLIEFEGLQYFDEIHPLVALKHLAKKTGSDRFTVDDFANYMKKNVDQVNTILFPLTLKGFIYYNSADGTIEIKKRLYDNISASIGRIDYDVIRILSITNAPLENASIDLRNNDLKIYGIPRIAVSDSQNVIFYPKDQTILMKHNRSFQFDGVVEAGLFTYYGRNFFFNYDEFKVTLKNVDSVHIKVITGRDLFNKPIFQDVQNVLQDVTGEVLIDKPDNKSGLQSHHEFPIFTSQGNSYVYYDDNRIFKGVYDRKREFYFQIYPYRFDSLNVFTKESMKFNGQFFSARIFPTIPENLVLQPDFSLGFKHSSPSEGFPIYSGKGKYNNIIFLSNKGLRGDGSLNYLTSAIKSGDFIFFPDSMNTLAPEFTIQAGNTGVQYPQVNGRDIIVHWLPYQDQMNFANKSKPFQMFNKETTLSGSLAYSSKGLTGKGTMDMTTALLSSKDFTYRLNTIDADTAAFKLRSIHKEGFTVITNNIKSHIDFSTRTGTFKSNDSLALTSFPENKYNAQLDEFIWKIDQKILEMLSERRQQPSTVGLKYGFKDQPLIGSKYISVKHGQDSLFFISPNAVYDYENNLISANRVKYIDVADARIFPEKENLVIETDAKIRPLLNAKVLANTESRFHNIYNASILISGRKKYSGNGKYDYIDENNKIETITFSEIAVDTSIQTTAEGDIIEPDNFTLNPDFKYQGKVRLHAAEKFLTFAGAVHIAVDSCRNYGTSWFMFETPIDPLNIYIPVAGKLKELNRKTIVLGSLLTVDSIHIYSNFFGVRKNYNDSIIGSSTGYLHFNKEAETYLVASKEKLKTPALPGPLVSINRSSCIHHDEGLLKLGVDFGQMKMITTGEIDHDLNKNQVNLRLMMSLEFFMYDKSMEAMCKMIDSMSAGKPQADISFPRFKKNFANLIGQDRTNKYYIELSQTGKVKELPEEFAKTIFLNDVRLVWDQSSRSYRSTGKIGIGYIYKHQINKYFEGYVEIWRKRTGDMLDLYIKVDDKTFYYFGYTRGVMQVFSSDNLGFNEPIRNLKDAQRELKIPHNLTPYSFLISTDRKMLMTRKRWLNRDQPPEGQTDQQEDNSQNEQPNSGQPSNEK